MVEDGYGDGEEFGDLRRPFGGVWLLRGEVSVVFPSLEASLYRGRFTKVVLFDLTEAAPTI